MAQASSSRVDDSYINSARYRASTPSTHKIDVAMFLASLATSKEQFYLARVAAWVGDTEYASSTRVMTDHPKFGELVNMGETALTFTLSKIRDGEIRVHWFPLLKRLSGEDPVPPEDRGYSDKMAKHWLDWGRGRGKV